MSRYFNVSSGLRGCYMPDNSDVVRVDTRRELKNHVEWLVAMLGYPFGGSKAAIAEVVAKAWRSDRKEWRDFVVPLAESRGSYRFGVFISNSTRADYLANGGGE